MSRMNYIYSLYTGVSTSERNIVAKDVNLSFALGVIERIMESKDHIPNATVTISRRELSKNERQLYYNDFDTLTDSTHAEEEEEDYIDSETSGMDYPDGEENGRNEEEEGSELIDHILTLEDLKGEEE